MEGAKKKNKKTYHVMFSSRQAQRAKFGKHEKKSI